MLLPGTGKLAPIDPMLRASDFGTVGQMNMDPRQWTSERPTKSGFYYYRQSNDEDPIVLKVEVLDDRKGVVWLLGDNASEPLEQCHGDWAGPIEPPG